MSAARLVLAVLALAAALAALAQATPLACSDCRVESSFDGYSPPVVVVESGGRVTWTSADVTHVQADTGPAAGCFAQVASPLDPEPEPIAFEIRGAALVAITLDERVTTCPNAKALPDGSFALAYHCALHPTMRGALVVTPATGASDAADPQG